MKILRCSVLLLALAAGLSACVESTDLDEDQLVLLEVEYINFATNPVYFGFYVQADGQVFHYDRGGVTWEFQDSAQVLGPLLEDKYAPVSNPLAFLAPNAAGLKPLIDAAAIGGVTSPKMECADAGTLTYLAYQYNPETNRYSKVFLRSEGDVARVNTSEAAQQLIAYIRSLGLLEELDGCDP